MIGFCSSAFTSTNSGRIPQRCGHLSVRRGFSVPEMLAVVAVITIILAILLPNLNQGRERARELFCKTQQRQIGIAMLAFAAEHKGSLPGAYLPPWSQVDEEKRCWMGNEAYAGIPYEGALVRHLGGAASAKSTYRCPSLALGVWNSGIGSNGAFDYCSLLVFAGAKRYRIPNDSQYIDAQSGLQHTAPTPLIVEEDPYWYLNRGNIEPGHSAGDRLGTWHSGGGNYIAVDGHSKYLKPDGALGPEAFKWTTKAPSGTVVTLSSHGSGWGGWNNR